LTYFKLVTETHGSLGEIAGSPPYAAFWTVNARASQACSLQGLLGNLVHVNDLPYLTARYAIHNVDRTHAVRLNPNAFIIYAGYSRKQHIGK
jgi:hypothetical protein